MAHSAPFSGAAGHGDDAGARRALPNWMPAVPRPLAAECTTQRLTGLQPSPLEQRQVGGLEREQEGGGLGVVELGGSVEDRDGVGDGVLGDATRARSW